MDRSKFNLSEATFINAAVQFGDENEMVIDHFTTYVNERTLKHAKAEEIKTLLKKLQESIANSPDIDHYSKTDATNDLAQIAHELSKPENEQDRRAIKHYCDKVIGAVKDVDSVLGVATTLAKILGLLSP